MAGARFVPVYFMTFLKGHFSIIEELLLDSSLDVHDAVGAGGSYALLSGSPDIFSIGVRGGVQIAKRYFVDISLEHAISGKRAPNFSRIGLNFLMTFDYYKKPRQRKRIKEIPFDSEHVDPDKNKGEPAEN